MNIEIPALIAANIEHFTGRTWLLNTLLTWFEQATERVFILTGDTGSGKSMFIAWLAGYGPLPEDPESQALLKRLRQQVRAVHFCMAASRNNSPQAFAEHIANQLTGSIQGFGDALAASLAEWVQINPTQTIGTVQSGATVTNVSIDRLDLGSLGDELSFDRAFTRPIKKLYESGYNQPLLVLVDALDETETYTGAKKLPELLAGLEDLPGQVRIVATTRPDPRILKYYRRYQPFVLIQDAPPNVDDIHSYALGRLARLEGLTASKASTFADRIAGAAKGIFLYAAIVLDELLPNISNLADLDLANYPLPDGLGGLYHDFLNRELGRDEDRWYESFKPMLGLIAVAQGGGLTRTQLEFISDREVEQPLRICRQYLAGELPDGPFQVFHKSFAEFLLEDPHNVDYHIDAAAMHLQIFNYYLNKYGGDWWDCDLYGLCHVVSHLANAATWDNTLRLLGDFTFLETKTSRLGIYDLLADLRTSLSWLPLTHPSQQIRRDLLRLLDLEAHTLHDWDSHTQPAFFAQQLHIRSVAQETSAMAEATRARLIQIGTPYLTLRFSLTENSPAFLRRLSGSGTPLTRLAVSPEGHFALAGSDELLKIWDIGTGELVHTFDGMWEAIGFTSNGKQAVLFHEGTLVLWDIKGDRQARSLHGRGEWARGLAVTPDGGYALCASFDHRLKLVDLATGELILQCDGPANPITHLVLIPDGHQAISAVEVEIPSDDEGGDTTLICKLKRWDLKNGQELRGLGDLPYIGDLAITPDSRYLIASFGWEIALWDLQTYQKSNLNSGSYLRALTISPDSRVIVCANEVGELRIIDMQTNNEFGTLIAHPYPSNDLAITPDGRYLVSICGTGEAKVWDWQAIQSGLTRPNILQSGIPAWVKGISPDGRLGIIATQDNSLIVLELETGNQPYGPLEGHQGIIRGVQFTSDSRLAVSGSDDGKLKVWDLGCGEEILELPYYGFGLGRAFVVIPADRLLAAAAAPGDVQIWDLQTRQAVGKPINIPDEVRVVLVTSDGQRIIVASQTTISVWAMETHQLLDTLKSPHELINDLVLTPDGQNLFSFGHSYKDNVGNMIGVYDLKERKVLPPLIGHSDWIRAVAVTSDNQYAISASNDTSIIVWKWRTPEAVGHLQGHTDWIYDMGLTQDDRRIFSISQDCTVRVWDWQSGATLAMVCLDSILDRVSIAKDGQRILVGDRTGGVYCLDYFEPGD